MSGTRPSAGSESDRRLALATSLYAQGRAHEAHEILNGLPPHSRRSRDVQYQLALCEEQIGNLGDAAIRLTKLLRENPNDRPSREALTRLRIRMRGGDHPKEADELLDTPGNEAGDQFDGARDLPSSSRYDSQLPQASLSSKRNEGTQFAASSHGRTPIDARPNDVGNLIPPTRRIIRSIIVSATLLFWFVMTSVEHWGITETGFLAGVLQICIVFFMVPMDSLPPGWELSISTFGGYLTPSMWYMVIITSLSLLVIDCSKEITTLTLHGYATRIHRETNWCRMRISFVLELLVDCL